MGSTKRPAGRKPRKAQVPTEAPPAGGASETMAITPDMIERSSSQPQEATRATIGGAGETMAITPSMVLPVAAVPPIPEPVPAVPDATMELTPDMVLGDASLMMGPAVIDRALRVVATWHVAVNAADAEGLVAICAEDVELAGPRGGGRGHAVLRDWLARAGFSARPRRWFCGGNGHVVVEQHARWRDREGAVTGVIASAFVVREGRIQRYERFDELATALTMYGLRATHEVTGRTS